MAIFLRLCKGYLDGNITYAQLKERVPQTTNWLCGSEKGKRHCMDCQDVQLVLGWCPIRDEVLDLDADDLSKTPFPAQFIMSFESVAKKKGMYDQYLLGKSCFSLILKTSLTYKIRTAREEEMGLPVLDQTLTALRTFNIFCYAC